MTTESPFVRQVEREGDIEDFIGDPVEYDWDAEVVHSGPSFRGPLAAPQPRTATAYLSPSLVKLRSGFRLIAPSSDTGSDGWIGNFAHCGGCASCCQLRSDHCMDCGGQVHALDKDKDLRSPYGVTMQMAVQTILNTPADIGRLNYIIWNKTIWSNSYNFQPRAYNGDNPHTEHAHFSGRYEDGIENDTRAWSIEKFAAPSAPTVNKGERMITWTIAKDLNGKLYKCNGEVSMPVTPFDIGHMKTLASEGRFQLLNADNPRGGWFEGAFGKLADEVTVVMSTEDREAITRAVAAALIEAVDIPTSEENRADVTAAVEGVLSRVRLNPTV